MPHSPSRGPQLSVASCKWIRCTIGGVVGAEGDRRPASTRLMLWASILTRVNCPLLSRKRRGEANNILSRRENIGRAKINSVNTTSRAHFRYDIADWYTWRVWTWNIATLHIFWHRKGDTACHSDSLISPSLLSVAVAAIYLNIYSAS